MGTNCCKRKNNQNDILNEDEKQEIKNFQDNKIIKEPIKKNCINIKLINKLKHSKINDKIEEVITLPNLENTIIIGCRSGNIKEISGITSENNSKI